MCEEGLWPAWFTQFFLLTSEGYFACQSIDLYSSLKNPFYSYRKRMVKYHAFSWGLGLVTASIPLWSDGVYGLDKIDQVNDSGGWLILQTAKLESYHTANLQLRKQQQTPQFFLQPRDSQPRPCPKLQSDDVLQSICWFKEHKNEFIYYPPSKALLFQVFLFYLPLLVSRRCRLSRCSARVLPSHALVIDHTFAILRPRYGHPARPRYSVGLASLSLAARLTNTVFTAMAQ